MKFIAEVGSNHNQNINRIYKFIEIAKKSGCWGIKFQLFKHDKLYSSEFKETQELLKKRELPEQFIPLISKKCKELKIKFGCTPFDLEAVEKLKNYVDFFKIGSYEILYLPLIKACASTQKPIIISTGMADISEIVEAVLLCAQQNNKNISLLHCVSKYPTYAWECNLDRIKILQEFFPNFIIGWSDHTTKHAIIMKAQSFGAKIIEFHLDLDGVGEESLKNKYTHCWFPLQMHEMIKNSIIWEAEGNFIKINEQEKKQRMDAFDGMRPCKEIRDV